MSPQNALDAAQLTASAGAGVAIVVGLVVAFLGVATARTKIGTAMIASAVLVFLYALSGGLLVVANAFALVLATITIAAAGAGTQHAITAAAADNKATP